VWEDLNDYFTLYDPIENVELEGYEEGDALFRQILETVEIRHEQSGNQVKRVISNYVDVKYREEPVDIADQEFEELDTSKSSFIRGAWYDEDNDYMIINLDGTYYQYCGMLNRTWASFKTADSFGSHYNKYIKGEYDCRLNKVPNY